MEGYSYDYSHSGNDLFHTNKNLKWQETIYSIQ